MGTRAGRWTIVLAIMAAKLMTENGRALCQAPVSSGAATSSPSDPVLAVAERWIGRALIVRGFWAGDDLKYDKAGEPISPGKVTDWTLAGFDLQKVTRRTDGNLELAGVRVAARWNPDDHTFERHLLKTHPMRMTLAAAGAAGVEAAIAAAFSVGIDPALERSMPSYWSHYFIPDAPWPQNDVTGKPLVARAAKAPEGLVYPELVKKAEPGFTAEASADHVKGTVRVGTTVDEFGLPQRITIRQPLGYGLDAKAVEAVEKYKFKAATVKSIPIAVEMVVNQVFE